MSLNIYLTFDGNCREVFEFYRSVFDGEFATFSTFGEGPPGMDVPESHKDQVMHVSLPIGASTLMGSDTGPGAASVVVGTNFSISVDPGSKQRCDELFARISEGGEVTMPLEEMFWGAYFGRCRDRFGVNWMINWEPEQQQG